MFNEQSIKNRVMNANAVITYLEHLGFELHNKTSRASFKIYNMYFKKRIKDKKGNEIIIKEHANPFMSVVLSLDEFVIVHINADSLDASAVSIKNNTYESISQVKNIITTQAATLVSNRPKCIKNLNKVMSLLEKEKNKEMSEEVSGVLNLLVDSLNDQPKAFESLSEE